ncbi:MAG TPA: CPBP family intramembrane glutamic endopeptidase [Steroidobacteraceae bacterium]|nr:CPBP family intramembrane glutamic endopeptidase [Steroidobacteraceae bacterium]
MREIALVALSTFLVAIDTGFAPPPAQVPVYLVNAAVMGLIWGMLRLISGSVVVASLSHGLWNGVAYVRDEPAPAEDHRALDHVAQLADACRALRPCEVKVRRPCAGKFRHAPILRGRNA